MKSSTVAHKQQLNERAAEGERERSGNIDLPTFGRSTGVILMKYDDVSLTREEN